MMTERVKMRYVSCRPAESSCLRWREIAVLRLHV